MGKNFVRIFLVSLNVPKFVVTSSLAYTEFHVADVVLPITGYKSLNPACISMVIDMVGLGPVQKQPSPRGDRRIEV